jgi:hypothetical protein
MQFLLLVHVQESGWDALTPEQQAAGSQLYAKYQQELQDKKHYLGGNRLTRSSNTTTVKVRDGKQLVTDGPYAEAKEQIGGYYLIEAKDPKEAVALAAQCPGAHHGTVEVRPIFAMGQAQTAR